MASDTIDRSQKMGIPIGADAMKIYLDLKNDKLKTKQESIFYNISELFGPIFKSGSSNKK